MVKEVIVMKQYSNVEEYADEIYNKLYARGRKAIDALKENGIVTKYDLIRAGIAPSQTARAIRDLKDHGIPIQALSRIKTPESSNPVVRYTFGDRRDIHSEWQDGRRLVPKGMKEKLIRVYGARCAYCGEKLEPRKLQVDHRLPVKYFGELSQKEKRNPQNYLLLCPECNRKKAEAVDEGCAKTCYKTDDMSIIKSCYWYDPINYTHVCMKPVRKLEIKWDESDVDNYEALAKEAKKHGLSPQDLVKSMIEKLKK